MHQEAGADLEPPTIRAQSADGGVTTVLLTGHWTLRGLAHHSERLLRELRVYTVNPEVRWNLSTIAALDSVGAFVLWSATGGQRPQHIEVRAEHIPLFRRWTERQVPQEPTPPSRHLDIVDLAAKLGRRSEEHTSELQ